MSYYVPFPEVFQLQQLALHSMAKKLWNNLFLQYPRKFSIRLSLIYKSNDQKKFKNRILNALSGLLPERFPKLFKDKVGDAILDIIVGYDTAFKWIIWYDDLIKFSQNIPGCKRSKQKLEDLLHSATSPNIGKYEAVRFIAPLGRFDDLSWAKVFLADENQSLRSRFYLACIYCFEEEIHSLWCAMKLNNQTLSQDEIEGIISNQTPSPDEINLTNSMLLIKLWISRLEGNTEDSFYVDGWRLAFDGLFEYGAIFFWTHCSDHEKAEIVIANEQNLDRIVRNVRGRYHLGFLHFIYSLFSKQLKDDLIRLGTFPPEKVVIFHSLLTSAYYKSILNDFLAFPPSVSLEFRKTLVAGLAGRVRMHFTNLENFNIMWNALLSEEKIHILDSYDIIANLILMNDFDLLEMIVLPLPRCEKEKRLFNPDSLMTFTVNMFSNDSHYEVFHCYFLFLLLDYDAGTRNLALRPDAANLLDRFMDPENYVNGYKPYVFEPLGFLNVVTEHLKENLPVVKELINRMDYTTITHVFLSREIYPLLSCKKKITFHVIEVNKSYRRKVLRDMFAVSQRG